MKKQNCISEEILENRIQKILSSVFTAHVGRFEDSCGPNEIFQWDSLNHLNLVMAINNEFGIQFGFEEMLALKTVGDIKKILKKHNIY